MNDFSREDFKRLVRIQIYDALFKMLAAFIGAVVVGVVLFLYLCDIVEYVYR